MNENEKYFLTHSTLLLLVVGAQNKRYVAQSPAQAPPDFFFHSVPEKLRVPNLKLSIQL